MALLQTLNSELYCNSNPEQQEESAIMARVNSHTSTLFHYTKTIDALLSILGFGLRFTYCLERYPLVPVREVGVPMISFCDIPISESVEHAEKIWFLCNRLDEKIFVRVRGYTQLYFSSYRNSHLFQVPRTDYSTTLASQNEMRPYH